MLKGDVREAGNSVPRAPPHACGGGKTAARIARVPRQVSLPLLPTPVYRGLWTYLQSNTCNTAGAITSNRTFPQWQPPLCFTISPTDFAAILNVNWASSWTKQREGVRKNRARLLRWLQVSLRSSGQNTQTLWPWFASLMISLWGPKVERVKIFI